MQVLRKIWAVILFLASLSWFSEVVRVIDNPHYTPSRFDIAFGLLFVVGALINWSVEEWMKSEK